MKVSKLIVGEGGWIAEGHFIKTTEGYVLTTSPMRGQWISIPDECLPDDTTLIRRCNQIIDREEDCFTQVCGYKFVMLGQRAWLDGVLWWEGDEITDWVKLAQAKGSIDAFAEQCPELAAYAAWYKHGGDVWELVSLILGWTKADVGYRLIRYSDLLFPSCEEELTCMSVETMEALQVEARKVIRRGLCSDEVRDQCQKVIAGKLPYGWRVQ